MCLEIWNYNSSSIVPFFSPLRIALVIGVLHEANEGIPLVDVNGLTSEGLSSIVQCIRLIVISFQFLSH